MAAKLIDLSFTLNGRKVKVQIAPDTMLFSLLREQGCASVRCALRTTTAVCARCGSERRPGAELLGSCRPC